MAKGWRADPRTNGDPRFPGLAVSADRLRASQFLAARDELPFGASGEIAAVASSRSDRRRMAETCRRRGSGGAENTVQGETLFSCCTTATLLPHQGIDMDISIGISA